jgi:hypothetical protein
MFLLRCDISSSSSESVTVVTGFGAGLVLGAGARCDIWLAALIGLLKIPPAACLGSQGKPNHDRALASQHLASEDVQSHAPISSIPKAML